MKKSIDEVTQRLREGMDRAVLSFPLTSFNADGSLDAEGFRSYVRSRIEAEPGAVFPACGTGEFFSLNRDEYRQIVRITVEESSGTPVVAGAGYGWANAVEFAQIAQEEGADAILLMPHYLIGAPQEGLVQQIREVAKRTELPVIVYQRGSVTLTPESVREIATIKTVIGFKDGHSDLDRLQRLKLAAPAHWLFFNGAATAELQARQYSAIGIRAYSSAVHAFAPEVSQAYFDAHTRGDNKTMETLLKGFYVPLVELRDKGRGYSVSLVKAAARLRGLPVGPVRAPLTDPTAGHLIELQQILDAGLGLAAELLAQQTTAR